MAKLLELLLVSTEVKPLLSSEHFFEDGTPLRIWASQSSLQQIDGIEEDPCHHWVVAWALDVEAPRQRSEPRETSAV